MSARPEQAHLPAAAESKDDALSEFESRILEFERIWAERIGPKEAAIRAEFDVPAARYYQLLSVLIDRPIALRSDPLLVRRLQRVRDARARARAARSFRLDPPPSSLTPTD